MSPTPAPVKASACMSCGDNAAIYEYRLASIERLYTPTECSLCITCLKQQLEHDFLVMSIIVARASERGYASPADYLRRNP